MSLPKIAYSTLNTDHRTLIAIKLGESGFYPLATHTTEDSAKAESSRLNAASGVTPPQARAMVAGSMFGWDCPAADPDSYEADGSYKPT